MPMTATYMNDLGRVHLQLTDLPSNVDYVTVERSTDGVRWNVVRGGHTVGVAGGEAKLDDFEYAAGVENTYRASWVDVSPVTFAGLGTASHADNANVTPALPTEAESGDLLVLYVAASGDAVPTAPDGWDVLFDFAPAYVYVRYHDPNAGNPTVEVSGGSAGDAVSAVIGAWKNAQASYTAITGSVNDVAAQNIITPTFATPSPDDEVILGSWKQSIATGATPPTGFELCGYRSTAIGDAQSLTLSHIPAASSVENVAASQITVTGGTSAVSRSFMWSVGPRGTVGQDTVTITPQNDGYWIKNPRRPNLNRKVTVTEFGPVERPSRSGIFDVIGRATPIAITERQGSRRTSIEVTTVTLPDAATLDQVLAYGDVLFFQGMGPDCPLPTMYAVIGDITITRNSKRTKRRFFDLPMTEVAAPDATMFVGTVTWDDVVTLYATWVDVLDAEPTWDDVLNIVADTEIITD